MGQCRACEGEKQEYHNQRQRDAQDKALLGFLKVESLFEGCNDCDDGQHEVDGVVVEKLACQFGGEGTEIEAAQPDPLAMETETDEIVVDVPVKDGNATDCRD